MSLIATHRRARVARAATFCTFVWLVSALVGAAELSVDPIRVELSAQQPTAAIIIKNGSDEPTSIQIQAVAWSQIDGKDVYTPTRELLVTPPIVTIAPKTEQVIRAALRRRADATAELTYRIYLQELPTQPAPGFTGLQVALRIGLPVFVKPQQGGAAPKMMWSLSLAPDGSVKVQLRNEGNARVQVSDFALYVPGAEKPIAGESASTYILAGQTHEWLLKTGHAERNTGPRLRLKAYTDAGNVDTELALEPP